MRISDWSSDVCSSDLSTRSAAPRWNFLPRGQGLTPRAARCAAGKRAHPIRTDRRTSRPCRGRSPARTPGGNGTMKDFTAMNRKYLAAAAAIVLVAGGTGYLLMDGDESAPGGEQAAAPSSATEADR